MHKFAPFGEGHEAWQLVNAKGFAISWPHQKKIRYEIRPEGC
jgi:hypothetical protein